MTRYDRMSDFVESVYKITCGRCRNAAEAIRDNDGIPAACDEFRSAGWTAEGSRVFCPECNGERP